MFFQCSVKGDGGGLSAKPYAKSGRFSSSLVSSVRGKYVYLRSWNKNGVSMCQQSSPFQFDTGKIWRKRSNVGLEIFHKGPSVNHEITIMHTSHATIRKLHKQAMRACTSECSPLGCKIRRVPAAHAAQVGLSMGCVRFCVRYRRHARINEAIIEFWIFLLHMFLLSICYLLLSLRSCEIPLESGSGWKDSFLPTIRLKSSRLMS